MKVYISDFNNVLTELKGHVDFERDWRKADILIMWQDVIGNAPNIVKEARSLGKKVYIVEHGLLSINNYIPPLNEPFLGDKYLAWGQRTKDWLTERTTIDPDRIIITGTLLQRYVIPRKKHDDIKVLYAPRHWGKEIPENLEVAKELRKSGLFVFTKLVDGEHDPQNYDNPISTNRRTKNHTRGCFDAISEADIVVGIGEGTFAVLTYLMDIPYISVDNWVAKDLLGKLYTREIFNEQISDACVQTSLDKLNDTIMYELEHDTKKEERKKFLKYALNVPCDPLKNFLDVIYER